MPALSIDHWSALREAGELENALFDGYPPPGDLLIGTHNKGAMRVAAVRLGVNEKSLRRRAVLPDPPGTITNRFGTPIDWGMYREPSSKDETDELKATVELYERTG